MSIQMSREFPICFAIHFLFERFDASLFAAFSNLRSNQIMNLRSNQISNP
jgi:hypothetical protein